MNDIFNYGKTAEGETSVILHELKIDQRLATLKEDKIESIINYLPTNDHKEFDEMVFSIDPENCTDMEDALSLKCLGNSKY